MERLFNIDLQLIFETVTLAAAMLVLFTFLSYMLFEPVRKILEKRRQRIVDEQEATKLSKSEADQYKEEYEAKLLVVEKEAEEILSVARKKAQKNEAKIVEEAKEEAARIIKRAQNEIELEKKRALDDMKQEIVAIASLMAEKVVSASMDVTIQDSLVEETLKEMGESTWQN